MTELRLRPRSATELIDAAFSLYRKNAPDYILVAAMAYTPSLLVQLIQLANPENIIGTAVITIGASLVSLVTYSLMTAVVVKIGSTAYLGGIPDVATTVREVLPRLGTLIVASIMKAIVVFLGAFALLVGAVYFAVRFFAVEQAVVLEGVSAGKAFERSTALSDGRKWHIIGTLVLAYIIYFMLSAGVIALAGVASLVGSPVILLVMTTLVTIVVYPMIGLTQMVLYYDARIRAEGFDLEQLADAL